MKHRVEDFKTDSEVDRFLRERGWRRHSLRVDKYTHERLLSRSFWPMDDALRLECESPIPLSDRKNPFKQDYETRKTDALQKRARSQER